MQSEMAGRIDFVKVNGDNRAAQPLMDKYHVRGYPTLIWLDPSGKVIEESSYEKPKQFRERIDRLLASYLQS
jgi:thioredoxin-related protein